ncbi:MAG: hypothetical protein AMXMBFR13_16770 [Phycisphaerae bacterium]
MSSGGRKSDYAILATLGVILIAALLAMTAAGWLDDQDDSVRGIRTTHSANIDGAMAAHALFERLGATLVRSEHALEPDRLAGMDVLWLIDPAIPVNGAEMRALEEWVCGGGVLVTTGLPSELFRGLTAFSPAPYQGCRSCRVQSPGPTGDAHAVTRVPTFARQVPLAQDVREVSLLTTEALPVNREPDEDNRIRVLFEDGEGPRIASRRVGRGQVIALADSSFLANGMIGRGDNAILALNLTAYALSQARGRNMAYDEYHLGFGQYESGMRLLGGMLFTTAPGWAVLSLTVAGVMWLLNRGRRFGPRRAIERVRRRSKLEFARATGATWRAAGAHRLALRLLLAAWRRRAATLTGLPIEAPAGQIAAHLARRTGVRRERCEAILRSCEQAIHGTSLSSRRFATLVEQLGNLEREALDADSRST